MFRLVLFYRWKRNGKPRTKTHSLVLGVAGLLNGWSVKLLSIRLGEFLRRFLLHLLPKGFVRIRHFGFLANRRRSTLLPLCFAALGTVPSQIEPETSPAQESDPLWRCPKCGGPMAVIERLTAAQIQLRSPPLWLTTAA